VTRHAIDSVVMIDLAFEAPDTSLDPRLMALRDRVAALLGLRLGAAVTGGAVRPGITV
jgi:hypothetical protein